eukprot:6202721-Pleurochrysis_carterae.AAC.1
MRDGFTFHAKGIWLWPTETVHASDGPKAFPANGVPAHGVPAHGVPARTSREIPVEEIIALPRDRSPVLTVIGSSNFGHRSVRVLYTDAPQRLRQRLIGPFNCWHHVPSHVLRIYMREKLRGFLPTNVIFGLHAVRVTTLWRRIASLTCMPRDPNQCAHKLDRFASVFYVPFCEAAERMHLREYVYVSVRRCA